MKISSRLFFLVAGLTVLMVGIGMLGLIGIHKANHSLQSVYLERTTPAVNLGQIDALSISNRMHVAQALANPTAEVLAFSVQAVERNRDEITRLWVAFAAVPHGSDEAALANAFAKDQAAFDTQGLQPALSALASNDITTAQDLMVNKMTVLAVAMKKDVDALKQYQIAAAQAEFDAASARYLHIQWASVLSMVLGSALAGALGFAIMRSITSELGGEPHQANQVAERVGAGDLAVPIALGARDQHSLMARLQGMQSSLAQVVRQVRHASESVATASAEIAQGNFHLSERTEQQASALQQTAASIQELGRAVEGNSQLALQANGLAQNSAHVAQRCVEAVGQVVDTMTGINQSSHQIADIIGVIDGIAFQTNILALNAAVEAARAGEQGRGFAVVASEVRSLASRSALAAREIKTLIEQSVERVEQGTLQVDSAGTRMGELVAAIDRLSRIIGDISAASSVQSQGVQQVSQAVSVIDQATQQNAALVEEMAAAASSLRSQSQELVDSVLQFKLGNAAQAPALQS